MNRRGFFGFLGKTAAAVAAAPVVAKAADAVERVQTAVPAAPVLPVPAPTFARREAPAPWMLSTAPYYIGCASTLAGATHYPIYLSTSYYSSCSTAAVMARVAHE